MKIVLVTASSLLLPFAIVASQFLELSGTQPVTFDQADRDHDGVLSRTEAITGTPLSVTFDTADANRDGALDPHEYLQSRRLVSNGDEHTLGIWY